MGTHLHVEVQEKHSRTSRAVTCCGTTYYWRSDSQLNPEQHTLRMQCRKCKTVHWKIAPKDSEPLE